MDNRIQLYFDKGLYPYHCTFNVQNDLILCGNVYGAKEIKKGMNEGKDRYIWIYSSTETENDKWMCKGIDKIPGDYDIISISKDDKIYLLSNDFIYEWSIVTRNIVRCIFLYERKISEEDEKDKKDKDKNKKVKKKDEEKEEDEEDEKVDKVIKCKMLFQWYIIIDYSFLIN